MSLNGKFYTETGHLPCGYPVSIYYRGQALGPREKERQEANMKIIGIRPSTFTGEDKTQISGKNIYLTFPLEKGEGFGAERVFLTEAKLSKWTYQPKVGDEVNVSYNRYGRCDGMSKA